MTVTRHQRSYETNETPNASTGYSERTRLLKTCQAMFAKELTDEEVRVWSDFLREFSMGELRFAFDNWTRNGRFFPKPRDIADQCEAFRIAQKTQLGYPGCDDLCKTQHWKGYGVNDVKWVFRHYLEEIARGGLRTPGDFFTELDSRREGGPPAWKR